MPVVEGKMYVWQEDTVSWVEIVAPVVETPVETPTTPTV
jgi:hypothetical protein